MIHTIPSVSGNRQLLQNCKLLSVIRMVGTDNVTSGKSFIKITSVGMGAAKSNETR